MSLAQLAQAVGTDGGTIVSWERGDTFPTAQFSRRLEALAASEEMAAVPSVLGKASAREVLEAIAQPATWRLVRKLLAHATLRSRVEELAGDYPDPDLP